MAGKIPYEGYIKMYKLKIYIVLYTRFCTSGLNYICSIKNSNIILTCVRKCGSNQVPTRYQRKFFLIILSITPFSSRFPLFKQCASVLLSKCSVLFNMFPHCSICLSLHTGTCLSPHHSVQYVSPHYSIRLSLH
jgi:hypothetical protein